MAYHCAPLRRQAGVAGVAGVYMGWSGCSGGCSGCTWVVAGEAHVYGVELKCGGQEGGKLVRGAGSRVYGGVTRGAWRRPGGGKAREGGWISCIWGGH
eukprot:1192737-Prorocentrum_minimum.AAC.2